MSEAIWFLKRCPLFEHLTPDECRRLDARSRVDVARHCAVYESVQTG